MIRYYRRDCDYLPRNRTKIGRWLRATIENEGYREGEINYIYCSHEAHLEVNRHYLGHDYQTDVITFDYSDLDGSGKVSGDIFVDPATVADNAALFATDQREEELRVIVHGVLHLCGYEDKSPEDEATMRQKENFYLANFDRQ